MKRLLFLMIALVGLVGYSHAQNCSASFVPGTNPNSLTATFYDSSYVTNGGSVASWLWNFGDGDTSTLQNPTHTYGSAGWYIVCLSIYSNTTGVTCTSSHCDSVYVGGTPTTCQAYFYDSVLLTPVSPGSTVGFYNYSPGINSYTTYLWDFGDGNNSTLQDPTHTYAASGIYNVCLTITKHDSSGNTLCINTFCRNVTVTIQNNNCGVGFQYTNTANTGTANFFSTATGHNISYSWSFGDGTSGTGANPTHTYNHAGTYYACVNIESHDSATGGVNCRSSFCDSVHISNIASSGCQVSFTNSQGVNSLIDTFFASTTSGSGIAYTVYTWSFGDGTSGTTSQSHVTHTYASAGRYYACVSAVVHDSSGGTCTSSHCDSVLVNSVGTTCQAYFYDSTTTATANGETVFFTNYSPGVNAYTTYLWSFGDGSTATTFDPHHTYAASGTYSACLTIVKHDSLGNVLCDNQFCRTITITLPTSGGCQASYQYSYNAASNSAYFTATTTGHNASYSWNFYDGTSGQGATISHTFATAGYHLVCVTVEAHDSTGTVYCTSTYCDSVYVPGNNTTPCHASFSYVAATTSNTTLHFINNSTGASSAANTTAYTWSFGDSTYSHLFDPTHGYPGPGTYHVCLTIVTYVNGAVACSDDTCMTVTVLGAPPVTCHAAYQYTATSNPLELHFQEYATGNNLSYAWDFGDGHTANTHDPVHVFASAGYYNVCLTVTDDSAGVVLCSDTYCDSVSVGAAVGHCSASYHYIAGSATNSMTYHFINDGTVGANAAGTYLWTFGDGDSSTNFDPSHTYQQAGVYSVCLTVTEITATGSITCSSVYCDSVVVGGNTNPTGPFSITGSVYNGYHNLSTNAIVYLITLDSFDLVAVDSVLAPQGQYTFNNVPGGQYLVKAALRPGAPSYHDYLPTYYGDSLFWLDATLLTVNQNIASVDIHLIQGSNPGGPGFVGGNIFQGANKAAAPGDPLGGYQIMVLNMDNSPVMYLYSNADGSYSFSDLAYGTYKIYTEVLGKQTVPAIVTVSAASEVNNGVNIIVDQELVSSSRVTGIDQPGSAITNANVFPNPVDGLTTLRFNVSKDDVLNLNVTNILGQTMMSNKLNVETGTNDIQLDMSSYVPGVYILSVKDSNNKGEIFRIVKQ